MNEQILGKIIREGYLNRDLKLDREQKVVEASFFGFLEKRNPTEKTSVLDTQATGVQ